MGTRLAAVLLLALAAGGCGMKGDLYFPEREEAPVEAAEGEEEEDDS